jgi:hypothetical protein
MKISRVDLEECQDELISYREMRETLLNLIGKERKNSVNFYHLMSMLDILDLSAKLMYDNNHEVRDEIYGILS